MTWVTLPFIGAMILGGTGALFGVGMARMIWADDLVAARRIDEIRSREEMALRSIIETQKNVIEILRGHGEDL